MKRFYFLLIMLFIVTSCGSGNTTVSKQAAETRVTVDVNEVNNFKLDLKKSIEGIVSLKKIDFNSTNDDYDSIKFGNYNGKDLEWFVLDKDTSRAVLITKNIIDAKQYDEKKEFYWEKSGIRKWLNNEFFTEAFTAIEKECIETVDLFTYYPSGHPTKKAQSNTKDKVYLIAQEEYINYGGLDSAKFASVAWDSIDLGQYDGHFWERTQEKVVRAPKVIRDNGHECLQGDSFHKTFYPSEVLGIRPIICVDYFSVDSEPFNIASSLKVNEMGVTFQLPNDAVKEKSSTYNNIIFSVDDIELKLSDIHIKGKEQKLDWDMSVELAHNMLKETLGLSIENITDFRLIKISDNVENAFYAKYSGTATEETIVGISFDYSAQNKIVVFRFKGNNQALINKIIDSISLEKENFWVKYVREHKDLIVPEDKVSTFVINIKTGVFHRPSCRAAKIMKSINKNEVSTTKKELATNGYHACDICHP